MFISKKVKYCATLFSVFSVCTLSASIPCHITKLAKFDDSHGIPISFTKINASTWPDINSESGETVFEPLIRSSLGKMQKVPIAVFEFDYDSNGVEIRKSLLEKTPQEISLNRLRYAKKACRIGDYLGAFNVLLHLFDKNHLFNNLPDADLPKANFLFAVSAFLTSRYYSAGKAFENMFYKNSQILLDPLSVMDQTLARLYFAGNLYHTKEFCQVIPVLGDWFTSCQPSALSLLSPIHRTYAEFYLASAYEELGDHENAIKFFEKILEENGCDLLKKFDISDGAHLVFYFTTAMFCKDHSSASSEQIPLVQPADVPKYESRGRKKRCQQVSSSESPSKGYDQTIFDIIKPLFLPEESVRLAAGLSLGERAVLRFYGIVTAFSTGNVNAARELMLVFFYKSGTPKPELSIFSPIRQSIILLNLVNAFEKGGDKAKIVPPLDYYLHGKGKECLEALPKQYQDFLTQRYALACLYYSDLQIPWLIRALRPLFLSNGAHSALMNGIQDKKKQQILRTSFADALYKIGDYRKAFTIASYFFSSDRTNSVNMLDDRHAALIRFVYGESAHQIKKEDISTSIASSFFSNRGLKAQFELLPFDCQARILITRAQNLCFAKKYRKSLPFFERLFNGDVVMLLDMSIMTDYAQALFHYARALRETGAKTERISEVWAPFIDKDGGDSFLFKALDEHHRMLAKRFFIETFVVGNCKTQREKDLEEARLMRQILVAVASANKTVCVKVNPKKNKTTADAAKCGTPKAVSRMQGKKH